MPSQYPIEVDAGSSVRETDFEAARLGHVDAAAQNYQDGDHAGISHSEAAHGLVLGPVRLRICPERILISLPPFTWGWGPPWSYIGLRKAKLSRTNPARKSDHTNQRATRVHTDANREFQEPPLLEKLSWFAAALLAFTAISFVYINWG